MCSSLLQWDFNVGKLLNVFRLLIFVILTCGAFSVPATENLPNYVIEIICFENLEIDRFKAEIWPQFVGKIDNSKALYLHPDEISLADLSQSLTYKNHLPSLNKKEFALNKESNIIKKNRHYRLIMHKAWAQHLSHGKRSKPVYIQGGRSYQRSQPHDSAITWEIEGILSFKPLHGLCHLELDVLYNTSADQKNSIHEFRITNKARLKNKDVYYFDHPIVGIIMLISKI